MRFIPFGKPIIGEEEQKVVADVLRGDILVHGPRAKEFEERFAAYVGAPYAISVSSCTAALHLAYFYLGIGKGDEVIVPAQTHTATAHAVELCGAKPVFVDAERETGNIAIDQIEQKITSATRAISVVHFLGMPVDMDRVMVIARKYNLFVVEDCALALGSSFHGKHMGLHGDVGCFSFYPVKHMTTAEGGMLITKHADVAEKIRRQRAFGVDRTVSERTIPGVYDVTMLGFNYRLNEIAAAIGVVQLQRVDGFLQKRKQNYEALRTHLTGINGVQLLVSTHDAYQSSYYCISVFLDIPYTTKRFEIVQYMKAHGIGTSVYYPRPVPLMSYYQKKYGYRDDAYPIASRISDNSIALPVGPHLTTDDMEYIATTLKNAIVSIG